MKLLAFNKTMLVGAVSLIGSASAVVMSNAEGSNIPFFANTNSAVPAVVASAEVNQEKSYILQGMASDSLVAAVEKVGGIVSKEFPIISAISALLTSNQLNELNGFANVRVTEDRTVRTESASKKFVIDTNITTQTNADKLHSWAIKGDGVTIAVLDSGIMLNGKQGSHLRYDSYGYGRVWAKYDAIEGSQNRKLNDDQSGHGSHISAIMASSLKDENGSYNGMAPDAEIVSVKAFDENGQSSYSTVLDGLNWVYKNRHRYNIKVLNLSIGASVNSTYFMDPVNQAVMKLWDAGVVVVTSAGNTGSDFGTISVPANNPYVITVGAITDNYTPEDKSDDRITTFSSRGPTLEGFVKPEIVTYGGHMAAKFDKKLVKGNFVESEIGEDYQQMGGTSQAAAVISGTVALMLQMDPRLSPDDVKCKLISSASNTALEHGEVAGPLVQGAGVVDAFKAVISSATGCANKGLDIEADLAGIEHFRGPIAVNSEDELSIISQDGTISDQIMPWTGTGLSWGANGLNWGGKSWDINGLPWTINGLGWGRLNDERFSAEGLSWGSVNAQGLGWSDVVQEGLGWANFQAQGLSWGAFGEQGLSWGAVAEEGLTWGAFASEGLQWTVRSNTGNTTNATTKVLDWTAPDSSEKNVVETKSEPQL